MLGGVGVGGRGGGIGVGGVKGRLSVNTTLRCWRSAMRPSTTLLLKGPFLDVNTD